MLFFSERIKLAKLFEKWADSKGVEKGPHSMIVYLMMNNLLDEGKALKLIESEAQNSERQVHGEA